MLDSISGLRWGICGEGPLLDLAHVVAGQAVDEADGPRALVRGEQLRDVLLERFRDEETSVLFASMTFWQGVDIPGRSLELVILESLPFAVPDDPLIAAKSERAEREGGSGFRDVQQIGRAHV